MASVFRNPTTGTYWIDYRDEHGKPRRKKTKFRLKRHADKLAAELEERAQARALGIVDDAQEHAARPLDEHVTAFLRHVEAGGCTPKHHRQTKARLRTAIEAMQATRLGDLTRDAIESWLAKLCPPEVVNKVREQTANECSPKTRDDYLSIVRQFLGWCVETDRLRRDPSRGVRRLVTRSNREARATFRRRPLTPEEVVKLCDATVRRGVERYLATHPRAQTETLEHFAAKGRNRAEAYLTAATVGLRLGSLRALRWSHVVTEGATPHLVLEARYQKNRRTHRVHLPDWLARRLAEWKRERAVQLGRPVRPGDPVFDLPVHLVRRLHEDLAAAGIAVETDEGVFDVHALRTTAATQLYRQGVHPGAAQAILAHSDVRTTIEGYTRIGGADHAAAVNALPEPALTPRPPVSEFVSDLRTEGGGA